LVILLSLEILVVAFGTGLLDLRVSMWADDLSEFFLSIMQAQSCGAHLGGRFGVNAGRSAGKKTPRFKSFWLSHWRAEPGNHLGEGSLRVASRSASECYISDTFNHFVMAKNRMVGDEALHKNTGRPFIKPRRTPWCVGSGVLAFSAFDWSALKSGAEPSCFTFSDLYRKGALGDRYWTDLDIHWMESSAPIDTGWGAAEDFSK
jgi:hypothetical protein